VAATFQTPTLFLVAEDLTKMQVSASVSESDIGPVAAGQEVSFSVDAYPATTFAGRVEQVRNAPLTVQNVVTYDVVVSVDNRDLLLKPGMTANVTIATATRPDALRVSTSALRFRPPADGDGGAAAAQARRARLGARRERTPARGRGTHRHRRRSLHRDHRRARRGRAGDRGAAARGDRDACRGARAQLRTRPPQPALT
jgi:HlyD family secretion protein